MRAWVFQDSRQKKKHGEKKCPWSVGWHGPDGRESKRVGSKSMAEKFRRKIEGEMAAGLYQKESRKSWADFLEEYERLIMRRWRSGESRSEAKRILVKFEEIAKPAYVSRISDHTLDDYVAKRLTMRGLKKGDTVSPETIKKELRTVRAALGIAKRWKYIAEVPTLPEIEGYGKDKPFVTESHFNAILPKCDVAQLPRDQHFTVADFWRALLATAWVTGMRRGALLSLLWEDVNLADAIAFSRHRDNKPKRDEIKRIGPVVELLRKLKGFDPRVFPWNHADITLDRQFAKIQQAAGVHLPCREDHEHTAACHLYGLHSFRYAHATYNFGRVSDRDLQEQMGHSSFTTTQRYIKYAEQHREKTYDVFLPESLKRKSG